MKDGLYVVYTQKITAAFVMRGGRVTACAPILRKEIEYWKRKARWVATDPGVRPVGVTEEEFAF